MSEISVTWLPGDIVTAAKLNAMQQSLAVEGDYTAYKFVRTEDYSSTLSAAALLISVANDGTVLFTSGATTTTLYKLTYSGAKASATGYTNTLPYITGRANSSFASQSALSSYLAFIRSDGDGTSIDIFKDGALTDEIVVSSDDATVAAIISPVLFSPNGRYFAVTGTVSHSGEAIILYEADV